MSWALVGSLLVVLALILISAVLATAETGITAASKARIHRLAREGNKRAEKVEGLLDERERVVGSILLGSTLVNNLAASLTTFVLAGLFGNAAVIYATIGITIMLLIFAEALPKTLGIARADRVALTLGPAMGVLSRLFAPVIRLVLSIVQATLRLIGIDLRDKGDIISGSEEIRGAIDLHAEEGGIIREHKAMLGSILDLDEVLVADVMVHRKAMEMIDAALPPEQIVRAIIRSSHTRLPLYRNDQDNIVGVLHAKDVMRALSKRGAEPETLNIDEIMTKPWFVPDTTTLREQLNAFMSKRSHFAMVVDEYGALQGLVTLEDILEEIVGDITDEHDLPTPAGVTVHEDGTMTVEGSVTIRDLNRRFDWSLPDEDATTIAGLVINEARVIPVKGQSFTFFDFRFDILERRRNQITLLKLTPPGAVQVS
ncbi:HlyC/CorC family transporter [Parapedomonas caeni]